MTNLEHAIKHIKTRADAWAVKEVTEALQSISERLDKALSQEPICDRDCEHCTWTECPIEPCDDAISHDFQIGDEVRIIGSDTIYDDCDVGWVIRNASEKVKTMYVMRNDGSAEEEAKAEWYKTGRHNAMLAEVIKALPSVTQKSVIERIRAEIVDLKWDDYLSIGGFKKDVLQIIDKYRGDKE